MTVLSSLIITSRDYGRERGTVSQSPRPEAVSVMGKARAVDRAETVPYRTSAPIFSRFLARSDGLFQM